MPNVPGFAEAKGEPNPICDAGQYIIRHVATGDPKTSPKMEVQSPFQVVRFRIESLADGSPTEYRGMSLVDVFHIPGEMNGDEYLDTGAWHPDMSELDAKRHTEKLKQLYLAGEIESDGNIDLNNDLTNRTFTVDVSKKPERDNPTKFRNNIDEYKFTLYKE